MSDLMPDPALQTTVKPPARPRLTRRRGLFRDILEVVIMVITIYTMVNLGTARAIVEGSSMDPNFATGQLVIVNRFAYYFSQPARGDVVVLHNPEERCKDEINKRSVITIPFLNNEREDGVCEDLIKRVIGLPGETITLRNGVVYANGTQLTEPYIKADNFCDSCNGEWVLTADQYFVMGDNRKSSYDSHNFGAIRRELLVGQAWVRYWPLNQFQIVPHPGYDPVNLQPSSLPTVTPTAPAVPVRPNRPNEL